MLAVSSVLVGCGGGDSGGEKPVPDNTPEFSYSFGEPEALDETAGGYSSLTVNYNDGVQLSTWVRNGQVFSNYNNLKSEQSNTHKLTKGVFDSYIPQGGEYENKPVKSLDFAVMDNGVPCGAWVDKQVDTGDAGLTHTLNLLYSCYDANADTWSQPLIVKQVTLGKDVNAQLIRDVRVANINANSQMLTYRLAENNSFVEHNFYASKLNDGVPDSRLYNKLIGQKLDTISSSIAKANTFSQDGEPILFWFYRDNGTDELTVNVFNGGSTMPLPVPTDSTFKYSLSLVNDNSYLLYSQRDSKGEWSIGGENWNKKDRLEFTPVAGEVHGLVAEGDSNTDSIVVAWIEKKDRKDSVLDEYSIKVNHFLGGQLQKEEVLVSELSGASNLQVSKVGDSYILTWLERVSSKSSVVKMIEYGNDEWSKVSSFNCGSSCGEFDKISVDTEFGQMSASITYTSSRGVETASGAKI